MAKAGHVKRPLNCFMLYSFQERPKAQLMHPDKTHSEISKILGTQWKALSPEQQKPYREEARSLKELHQAQFPCYKYKPTRKGRSAAHTLEYSSQGTTMKIAPRPQFINKNLRPGNISPLSDSTASGDHNDLTVVQKTMPPMEPVLQEPVQYFLFVPSWQ